MSGTNRLSNERLAQKIRWEGGILAALEYGINSDDIDDPGLSELWQQLDQRYQEIAPLLDEMAVRLDVEA
jgi:hypothetical protein